MSANAKPSFETMGLKKELINGIFAHGFEEPSAIQAQAIPQILTGKDTICQAQSGTGKTATFAISALQRLDTHNKNTQIIILSPTRELAMQSYDVVTSIGQRMDFTSNCFVGGVEVAGNVEALKRGCQIAVGTPGRIMHMIESSQLRCNELTMMIIDEADEMLSRGFAEQLVKIFKCTPKSAQVVLVSATMPQEILNITNDIMTDPVKILVKEDELTLDGIRQYQVSLQEDWKMSTFLDIFKVVTVSQAVVFCNSIGRVKALYQQLQEKNFACACIHSDMDQAERNKVIDQFRKGEQRILIATNIVARGIDVQNVSLVVNFDIPKSPETYLHRIGRSGRFGRKGFAINFVTERDAEHIKEIEEKFNTKIEPLPNDLAAII